MVNSVNIKQLISELNLSISQFEKKINVGASTISRAIKENKNLSPTIIQRITETFPNVSSSFIKTGEQPIFLDAGLQVNESEVVRYGSKKGHGTAQITSKVPFYDVDFIAGYSGEFLSAGGDKPLYWLDLPEFSNCIAFRAYSDSMEPIIKSGNILLGRKIEDWESHLEYGQIYGITTTDNRRYLKYIRKAIDYAHYFLLRSEKEGYDDFEIPKDKIKNIWLIEGWLNRRT